jgi:enamine deaminase RidA (YjgF/YER057c/UK114 family)
LRYEAIGELLGATLGLWTLVPSEAVDGPGALADLYGDLARTLHERDHVLLHEKAFGLLALAPAAAAARDEAFRVAGLPPPVPHTYLEGRPCRGGALAGIQAWSVRRGDGVEGLPPDDAGGRPGAGFRTDRGTVLFLSALTGRAGSAATGGGAEAECRAMFEAADAALRAHGLAFRDVARTWIFMDRLLADYGDLNAARTAFFARSGLVAPGADSRLPASTGIQGRHASGAAAVMDLLAVRPAPGADVACTPLPSTRQDAAFAYGSAFSRGMRVGTDDASLVLVSGTASIGPDGLTRYRGDPQGQVAESYLDVAAVLRAAGARFPDVVQAVRYHKDESAWQVHREMADLGLLPDLPAVDVFEDVCRPDLLFEMEATALRRDPGPGRP